MMTLRTTTERTAAETALLHDIVGAAILGNWRAYHSWLAPAVDGFPDITLLRGGEMLLWGIKPEHGRVTAAETYWINAWVRFFEAHQLGECCEARTIWPADLEACIERLEHRST